ncbi:unnamed protein product [Kluyveromyces dobzhanskii CBS 2104]|uniref:WGS project CCBQ000000000 data, contig 00016 n=1 Tax=Kluyveromyces dobzhanskii CBS 2104 TaxID=1427455 RepID=A0A0A8KZD4_9SACH|nr:unnamed protein product [Kluyveromyces dobzhanskii CBS 2104]
MVLYKRKTITLPDARPLPSNINRKIWYIQETGEWFLTYAEFLTRLDFYRRHYFTCEITGTSCLTFFEALNSEEEQFQYVEKMFPLKLREPVAKFIHFNEIRRLDMLVEQVYAKFKNDYFPGETVYLRKGKHDLTFDDAEKHQQYQNNSQHQKVYIIKEKAQFNAVFDRNTSQQLVPAHAKYMLQETHGTASIVADEDQIYRDRSCFTKHLIKCFCKITLRRASSKMGAPWCVKDEYLPIYNLSSVWPEDMLKYKEDYVDPRHVQQLQQTAELNREKEAAALNDLKRDLPISRTETPDQKRIKTEELVSESSPSVDHTSNENNQASNGDQQSITQITEDLEIPFMAPRPSSINGCLLRYSKDYVPIKNSLGGPFADDIGKLLHCYQFLIAFNSTLQLSEFSWDDFVSSLRFTNPRQIMDEFVTVSLENGTGEKVERFNAWNEPVYEFIDSLNSDKLKITIALDDEINDDYLDEQKTNGTSLLVECFCSLLRLFIDADGNWTTLVTLNWLGDGNDSDGNSDKSENKEAADEDHPDLEVLLEKVLNYRKVEWTDRLAKRQFNNGFWLIILLGVLQDCMHLPIYKPSIENFIRKLVPSENSPSNIALNKLLWRKFCKDISIEEKIGVMWMLVEVLSNYSSIIRSAMDDSMELCNQIRSERFRLNKDLKTSANTVIELKEQSAAPALQETEENNESTVLKEKLDAAAIQLEQLQRRKNFLDVKLIEKDLQRLKPLGYDRYGNKIYWLEYCGVSRPNMFSKAPHLLSNRLWIQGPVKEAALHYFKIREEEYDHWISLAAESGKASATKEVFHVYRDEKGCYFHHDTDGDIMLINEDGVFNNFIELSPLQRKIIDETPEGLLLSPNDWVFLQDSEQLTLISEWWDSWGSREHETQKQLQTVLEPVMETLNQYNTMVLADIDQKREALLKEVSSLEITDEELHVEDAIEDADESDIEDELQKIAQNIISLDDSSKTRKILLKLEQLEAQRDELLAKKKALDGKESENGSKSSRQQRKYLRTSRDRKITALKETLDKLVNLKRESERIAITNWTNEKAIAVWSTELFKCNGNPKSSKNPGPVTVNDTFSKILQQASVAEYESSKEETETGEETEPQSTTGTTEGQS